jgi:hypothetical protein
MLNLIGTHVELQLKGTTKKSEKLNYVLFVRF